MSSGISLAAVFSADGAAQSADGIPLDTFPAPADATVIGVVVGPAKLPFNLICILAAVRSDR